MPARFELEIRLSATNESQPAFEEASEQVRQLQAQLDELDANREIG